MLRTLGNLGAALVAVAFLGLGAGSLADPRKLARNYGIPVDDAGSIAYVRATGMRDALLGALIFAFLRRDDRPALATTVGFSSFAGASDFALVATTRGTAAPLSLGIHGGGTLGLLALWTLLRAET
jgi:hypothetical protein